MSGRGDNNKKGTSGQGGSNQSMQGQDPSHKKAYHGDKTGGQRSEPQKKKADPSANRNTAASEEE
jgi:hypothetical protein